MLRPVSSGTGLRQIPLPASQEFGMTPFPVRHPERSPVPHLPCTLRGTVVVRGNSDDEGPACRQAGPLGKSKVPTIRGFFPASNCIALGGSE